MRPAGTLSIAELNQLRAAAQQRSPNFDWPRFEEMFRIVLPKTIHWGTGTPDPQDPRRGRRLAQLMRQNLAIDAVEVRIFPARPANIDPPSASAAATDKEHLEPAPKGIGVEAAWNASGGGSHGETELLTHVDRAWLETHEEFKDYDEPTGAWLLTGTTFTPVPGNTLSTWIEDIKHGTATLSIALGRLNRHYGVGVAPQRRCRRGGVRAQ